MKSTVPGSAKDTNDEDTVFALMELTLHSGREVKTYNIAIINIDYIKEVGLKFQDVLEYSRELL